MTINKHHELMPDAFTLNVQRAGDLDWELSITISRKDMMTGDETGIYEMAVIVNAHRWGKTRVLRRPKLLSFATITYAATVRGLDKVDTLHSMDDEGLQAQALAEEFLWRNRIRVDQLIELDDRIVTGDCRCEDCTFSFEIPIADGWSVGNRIDPSWLLKATCDAGDTSSR